MKKIIMTLLALTTLYNQADACTAVDVTSKDGSVIAGRTMDWSWDMQWEFVYAPQSSDYTLSAPSNLKLPVIHDKTKYAFFGIGSRMANDALLEGQNSAGLAVSGNYLPQYTQYNEVTKQDKKYVSILELVKFVLGNFATVDEVKQELPKYKVWSAGAIGKNANPLLHFMITDKSGKSVVIEYVGGKTVVYDKNYQVLTNAPTYDWHMNNLRQYMNVSNLDTETIKGTNIVAIGSGNGMWGTPGDYTPPSRFVRTSLLKYYAVTPESAPDAVTLVGHILNSVTVPKGAAKDLQNNGGYSYDETQWTAIKDITHNKFYFNDYQHNNNVVELDLNQIFTQSKPFTMLIADLQYPNTDLTQKFLQQNTTNHN